MPINIAPADGYVPHRAMNAAECALTHLSLLPDGSYMEPEISVSCNSIKVDIHRKHIDTRDLIREMRDFGYEVVDVFALDKQKEADQVGILFE